MKIQIFDFTSELNALCQKIGLKSGLQELTEYKSGNAALSQFGHWTEIVFVEKSLFRLLRLQFEHTKMSDKPSIGIKVKSDVSVPFTKGISKFISFSFKIFVKLLLCYVVINETLAFEVFSIDKTLSMSKTLMFIRLFNIAISFKRL